MTNSDDKNISGIYRKLTTEKPSSELDNRILAAAHEEAPKISSVVPIRSLSPKWLVPLTLAATVVLSVSVVLTIPDADFQKTSEHDYVIPESVEEQKINTVAEKEVLKKAKTKKLVRQEKATEKRSSELAEKPKVPEEVVRKNSFLRMQEVRLKPAEAPPPARSLSLESESDSIASSAPPRDRAMVLRKQMVELANKQVEKKLNFKDFIKNFGKVVAGDNKRKVLELLGTPFLKNNNYWHYQYIVEGTENNYFIRFKNNLVTKIEQPK